MIGRFPFLYFLIALSYNFVTHYHLYVRYSYADIPVYFPVGFSVCFSMIFCQSLLHLSCREFHGSIFDDDQSIRLPFQRDFFHFKNLVCFASEIMMCLSQNYLSKMYTILSGSFVRRTIRKDRAFWKKAVFPDRFLRDEMSGSFRIIDVFCLYVSTIILFTESILYSLTFHTFA